MLPLALHDTGEISRGLSHTQGCSPMNAHPARCSAQVPVWLQPFSLNTSPLRERRPLRKEGWRAGTVSQSSLLVVFCPCEGCRGAQPEQSGGGGGGLVQRHFEDELCEKYRTIISLSPVTLLVFLRAKSPFPRLYLI
jgi:hypothetical protein